MNSACECNTDDVLISSRLTNVSRFARRPFLRGLTSGKDVGELGILTLIILTFFGNNLYAGSRTGAGVTTIRHGDLLLLLVLLVEGSDNRLQHDDYKLAGSKHRYMRLETRCDSPTYLYHQLAGM